MEQDRPPDWFSKPGDTVRVLIQRRGVDVHELASSLDGGLQSLRGILAGTYAIEDKSASVLAAHLGGTKRFWLQRQTNYELALERAVQSALLEDTAEWLARVPSPEPKRRGPLSDVRRAIEVRQRLTYFSVGTLDAWDVRYGNLHNTARYRTTKTFETNNSAVLLWLRRAELEADLLPTRSWNPDELRKRLGLIRSLTRHREPKVFFPRLRALCAEAGVAVVGLPAPTGCRASGASRMIAPDKAMIILSFRYRADDQFWFTVFHEIGHLLLHTGRSFVDDGSVDSSDACEEEANRFASSQIITDAEVLDLTRTPLAWKSIVRFSSSAKLSPGLVLGQLQHRGIVDHRRFNFLKRHWTNEDVMDAIINL